MRKLGILGGTFDPPHIGHLILAQYTREILGLDQVLFVPAGDQPFKPQTRTARQHRLAMVERAISLNPHFVISEVELHRPGPHYTADTLYLIQQQYPGTSLYFLMGGDNLREFPKWTRADEIIRVARLAVMRRSDEAISADMHDDVFPDLSQYVDIVDTPLLSIWLSSTHVVERLQQGLSVRYLVPDAVLDYIRDHQLYTPERS